MMTTLEIGKAFEVYGTLSETPHGFVITADTDEHRQLLENIVRNTRTPGQSDADVLATLQRQLRGMLWARPVAEGEQPS